MRREFFILANVNETQRYAKWNERTPEGKRRKQMAQVNLEIVLGQKSGNLGVILFLRTFQPAAFRAGVCKQ